MDVPHLLWVIVEEFTGFWLDAAGDTIVLDTLDLEVLMGTLPCVGCWIFMCHRLAVVDKRCSDTGPCAVVQLS